jgi:hypothetical protein
MGEISIFITRRLGNVPLSPKVVDVLYKQGYITTEDYGKFYLDDTGTFVPKLMKNSYPTLAAEIDDLCFREEVFESKNVFLHKTEAIRTMME